MPTEHSTISDPEVHEPKGITASASGQVYVADGAASGDWKYQAEINVVYVTSSSDFPTPSGGVITLAANTVYHVTGQVDIGSDRIVMSNLSVLRGYNQDYDEVVSSTTGVMITQTDVSARFIQIKLTCASGTLLDVDGTGTESCDLIRVQATCDTIGDFDNMGDVDIFRSSFKATTAGMTFTGAFTETEIRSAKVDVAATNGTCVDLGTATFNILVFDSVTFVNPTGTGYGIDVAAAGANLNTGKIGIISKCNFSNISNASNYVAGALGFVVSGSVGVNPSTPSANGYITGNATATTFSGTGAGNDVIVAFGTGFNAGNIQRKFTTANTGITTFNGDQTVLCEVSWNITASIGGGAARTYNFYTAKNGTILASSITQRTFDGTNKGALTCSALVELSKTDTVSLRVRAETATTAITVDTTSFKIVSVDQ